MFDITVTERCHQILADHISEGDLTIDCTAGNGHDTLFLANAVGPSGMVLALDVQKTALASTKKLLSDNGIASYFATKSFTDNLTASSFKTVPFVTDSFAAGADTTHVGLTSADTAHVGLICDSHENLEKYCDKEPQIIMFNLGYLPGGDHTSVTTNDSTTYAVKKAIHLVKKGGIVSVVTYPGHQEGAAEDRTLSDLFSNLDPTGFEVLFIGQHNRNRSPNLYLILKK